MFPFNSSHFEVTFANWQTVISKKMTKSERKVHAKLYIQASFEDGIIWENQGWNMFHHSSGSYIDGHFLRE